MLRGHHSSLIHDAASHAQSLWHPLSREHIRTAGQAHEQVYLQLLCQKGAQHRSVCNRFLHCCAGHTLVDTVNISECDQCLKVNTSSNFLLSSAVPCSTAAVADWDHHTLPLRDLEVLSNYWQSALSSAGEAHSASNACGTHGNVCNADSTAMEGPRRRKRKATATLQFAQASHSHRGPLENGHSPR